MDVYRRIATYTDGTEVNEGDRIRYRQAPGGLLAPSTDWKEEGIAAKMREYAEDEQRRQFAMDNGIDVEELVLISDDGRRYSIVGHIIERL